MTPRYLQDSLDRVRWEDFFKDILMETSLKMCFNDAFVMGFT